MSTKPMIEQKIVRMALFGPGGFGQERARALRANPYVEFAACYSPVEEERVACQREFGAQAVESEATIWDDPSIDAVILSTPNHLHLEHTRMAAATGKHVFVEKPIAPTVADAMQMIQSCQQSGVTLMVGHNDRRRERTRIMKRYLEEGRLGRSLAVEANNSNPGGLDIPPGDWRGSRQSCPGGSLIQLGIHKSDTLQYLIGPVARVTGWQRRLAVEADIDDVTTALLEFENGALGYLGAHYNVPHTRFVHILGTEANLRWDRAMGLVFETKEISERIPVNENDTLQEEIDEFVQCILTGARPEVGGEEALRALAVVEAAVWSSQRGRPVEIAEVLGQRQP